MFGLSWVKLALIAAAALALVGLIAKGADAAFFEPRRDRDTALALVETLRTDNATLSGNARSCAADTEALRQQTDRQNAELNSLREGCATESRGANDADKKERERLLKQYGELLKRTSSDADGMNKVMAELYGR